ncbi:hypothetical protein [Paenibacillus campi]|uniref:hypothetical protein n=1 Tax=Paenibacillus campi TaxID=3106031 RepID=UPI002AFE0A2F|nr:hypothetical protein [Paenibacillus sp. SGZ-1014]
MYKDRYRKLTAVRPPLPPSFTAEHHLQTSSAATLPAPSLQPMTASGHSLQHIGIIQAYMGNQAAQQLVRGSLATASIAAEQVTAEATAQTVAATDAVVQRVSAHRVEYENNRKVETDEKGHVTRLNAPIDISFGTEEHSLYFAAARKEDQLTGLRTVHWEMDDDWWEAAYYYSYQGKKPTGKANSYWLRLIKEYKCEKMSPSDGKGVSKEAKKSAPHFGANWEYVLNKAIVKGKGSVEDTEAEMRAQIAERAKTKGGAASSSLVDDSHEVG